MGLFNKKYKVNEKEYGHILARIIFTSAQNNFTELLEDNYVYENKLYYFSQLLLHYTYICYYLLKEKYPSSKVDSCITYTLESFSTYFGLVEEEKQDEFMKLLHDMYFEIKKNDCNIFTESGLHKLTQSFQDCLDVPSSFIAHLNIFAYFSAFIIHHSSDIVNDKLILI